MVNPNTLLASAFDEESPIAASSPLRITYYTDPLCAWSWAFEPQWRRLRFALGDQVQWRYCLGGLLPTEHPNKRPTQPRYGNVNYGVHRRAKEGAKWFQVRAVSGMPLNKRIWFEDGPSSSQAASLAVKAAEAQGQAIGEAYLRSVRRAALLEGRNIASAEVLHALAAETPGLDSGRFAQTLAGDAARAALHADLQEVKRQQIGRLPTLILYSQGEQTVILAGYYPYTVLLDALTALGVDVHLGRTDDLRAYAQRWGEFTSREAAELFDGDQAKAERQLAALEAQGVVQRRTIAEGHQFFWQAKA